MQQLTEWLLANHSDCGTTCSRQHCDGHRRPDADGSQLRRTSLLPSLTLASEAEN